MSNDPKTDLLYAILAMDTYNRGYGASMSALGNAINESKIGNFIIVGHSNDEQNADTNPEFDAGFYAITYKKGSNVVIAYRGTDKNSPIGSEGSDALNGYGIAVGSTTTNQGELAAAGHLEKL